MSGYFISNGTINGKEWELRVKRCPERPDYIELYERPDDWHETDFEGEYTEIYVGAVDRLVAELLRLKDVIEADRPGRGA